MKKLLLLVASLTLVFALSACGGETYEIAMITDSGDIDDESFNQGTWEGIVEFAEENDLTHKYYKPSEVSDAAYLDAIELAIEGGAEVVVTPGFLFEVSVFEAQSMYPDVKFILIDGEPNDGDWSSGMATYRTDDNVLPVLFNEHESGFLAGYAAVMDGYRNLGFTGGMAVPAVVKFGVGFVAGAYYAANELEVDIDLGSDNYHYFGNFAPDDAHKTLVAGWYATGKEVVFAAASGAGASVMAAASEADAMMIGVDIDQADQSDTVLTSALKELGNAVKQALQDYLDDDFVGGTTIRKGAENDGVGLPMDSSRFDTFTTAQYNTIYGLLEDGTVEVPASYTELATFLGTLADTDTTDAPTENAINCTTE